MRGLYFLFISGIFFLISCAGPVSLSYRGDLKAGDMLYYQTTQSSDSEVRVMGQTQKSSQMQVMQLAYKAEKSDENGNTQMSVRINEMQVSQINPQMTIEFDSEKEDGGMFESIFRPMVGHDMSFTLDSEGNFKDFSGSAQIFEEILGSTDVPGMDMVKSALEGQFGDDAMEKNFNTITRYVPNKSIKVGESWTRTDSTTQQTNLVVHSTLTLKKRSRGIAYIEVEGTLSSLKDAPPMDMGMMKIYYDLSGTQKGMVEVDEQTGLTQKSDLNMVLGGTMKMESDMVGNMEMDLKVTSKEVFEKIEK